MALKSFTDVQEFFNNFVSANGISMNLSPHLTFWQQTGDAKQDYQLFINGTVPGQGGPILDPDTNDPIPVLKKGDSKNSAIIHALSGTTTLFDPNSPQPPYFGQMPFNGPYFSAEQIQELADWIDAGCPE